MEGLVGRFEELDRRAFGGIRVMCEKLTLRFETKSAVSSSVN